MDLCKNGQRIFVILLFAFLNLVTLNAGISAAAAQYGMYAKVENFTWEEFIDGNSLLKEDGPVFGIGALCNWIIFQKNTLRIKGEIFGGSVDYNGHSQSISGELSPLQSETDYKGFKVEEDFGYLLAISGKSYVEPFLGIGGKWWERSLNSGVDASGQSVRGYDEDWMSIYARFGVRAHMIYTNQMIFHTELGVKLPFKNENEIKYFGVTLEPGNKASFFAEAGIELTHIKCSIFYDSMRFSKSDYVNLGEFVLNQPETEADIFGVTIGFSF